jgi:hypothetical protein
MAVETMVGAADAGTDLHRVAALFREHRAECTGQLSVAGEELARLQTLLDDAMGQMAVAFRKLVSATSQHDDDGSGVLVTTLQYQDICSQLLVHLRRRLTHTGALVDGLNDPFAAVLAAACGDHSAAAFASSRAEDMNAALADVRRLTHGGPVRQEAVGCGDVELF